MKHKKCFVNAHCCFDCPNALIELCDYKFGFGIASDIGFEEVKCKDCYYNSGLCEDCLLEHTSFCPDSVIGGACND